MDDIVAEVPVETINSLNALVVDELAQGTVVIQATSGAISRLMGSLTVTITHNNQRREYLVNEYGYMRVG